MTTMAKHRFSPALLQLIALFVVLLLEGSQAQKTVSIPVYKGFTSATYLLSLTQGSPPNKKLFAVDLTTDYTWFRCDGGSYTSKTYKPVPCNAKECKNYTFSGCGTCFAAKGPGCNNNTCVVPGFSTSFELTADTAIFPAGGANNHQHRYVALPRWLFACTLGTFDTPRGASGIAGLSPSTLGLPRQVSAALHVDPVLTLCLPRGRQAGFALVGPSSLGDDKFVATTKLIRNPKYLDYYYMFIFGFQVAGNAVPLDNSRLDIDSQGKGGTRVTGTSPYTIMERGILNIVVSAFVAAAQKMGIKKVANVAPFEACFDARTVKSTPNMGPAVPTIDLLLTGLSRNFSIWQLDGAHSMVEPKKGVLCLSFVANVDTDPLVTVSIGNNLLMDTVLEFDIANSRIRISKPLATLGSSCSKFTSPS